MFDRFANGKNAITKADLPPPMQDRFDQWAQRLNVTNGQITREQFNSMMQQGGGQGGGAGPAGGNARGNGNGQPDTAAWAENMFRQLDQNGDGLLNNDEMPEALRAERDKWDTDKNGLIDLNEFKAYIPARAQQWQEDRNAQGNGWQNLLVVPGASPDPPAEEERAKPVAYRAGKLPKELPSWFQELDTDGDAQIGLYEWKASGGPLDEFFKMDRNGDGFLTVQEVLYYTVGQNKNGNGAAGASPAGDQSRSSFFSGPGGNGRRNDNAGGNGNGRRNGGRRGNGGG